jgi:co-chaperonin GroES (HSP10)
MRIEPLFDRVVLKAIEQASITSSGIYIPDSNAKERPFIYEIVAVWPGKVDRNMSSISVWDKVLAGQYSGDEVKVWTDEFKVVAVEYILGKIV